MRFVRRRKFCLRYLEGLANRILSEKNYFFFAIRLSAENVLTSNVDVIIGWLRCQSSKNSAKIVT